MERFFSASTRSSTPTWSTARDPSEQAAEARGGSPTRGRARGPARGRGVSGRGGGHGTARIHLALSAAGRELGGDRREFEPARHGLAICPSDARLGRPRRPSRPRRSRRPRPPPIPRGRHRPALQRGRRRLRLERPAGSAPPRPSSRRRLRRPRPAASPAPLPGRRARASIPPPRSTRSRSTWSPSSRASRRRSGSSRRRPWPGARSSSSRTGDPDPRSAARSRPPFLDVSASMVELLPDYDERGLLGLAFHPDFADERPAVRLPRRARDGERGRSTESLVGVPPRSGAPRSSRRERPSA